MLRLLGVALLALQAPDLPLPELRLADREAWREHVDPAGPELSFEAIDWIPSFAEGLREADLGGRPLLFWAMNGHPLGCT